MSTLPASKPFALLPHLHNALTQALASAPSNASATPREIVSSLFAVAVILARAVKADPLEALAVQMAASSPGREAEAHDLIRRCYAAARTPAQPSN